ncbi:MAG: hypothetical protein ACTJIB_10535 [Pseudoalteromonas prydzensis]|uniref:hypothetical protein n=1 Tax=Pseudoalteromonas prydzensis TaxID=182141 RepID=UPI003F967877
MVYFSNISVAIVFFVPVLLAFFANACIKVGESVDNKSEKLVYVFMTFAISLILGILISTVISFFS